MSLADRIVVMDEGRIRQVGSPAEVYDRPADLFVASFVGSPGMNFIRGEVAGSGGRGLFVSETGRVRFDVPLEGTARVSSGPSDARHSLRARAPGRGRSDPGSGGDRGIPRQRAQRPRRGRLRPDGHARRRGGAVRARRRGSARPRHFANFDLRRRDGGAAVTVGSSTNETPRDTAPAPGAALAPFLSLRGVCKRLGATEALRGIDLEAGRDELLVVLGPTGAGKTTLLRTIAGSRTAGRRHDHHGRPGRHRAGPGLARRRPGVPELLALSALVGAAEPRVPAARPRPQPPRSGDPDAASPGRPICSASRAIWIARPRGSRAARCSAWRSAARSCAGPGCS